MAPDHLLAAELETKPAGTRALPNDPGFGEQWHLYRLDSHGNRGVDLRVTEAWVDYTGRGVSVALHEGHNFDRNAVDLVGRAAASTTNNEAASVHSHTTYMATMIAGNANNGIGGAGVAPGATISAHIGDVGMYQYDVVNTAVPVGGMFSYPTDRLDDYHDAARLGRDGLGTIQVRAAGNGAEVKEQTSFNAMASDQTAIVVAAVTSENVIGSYSTTGSSVLVSGFGGHGAVPGLALRTSGADGTMQDFGGTSGASAQVAGVVALMLEANPELGYRDVQEILAYSSRQVDPGHASWQFNGATTSNGGGLHTSQSYGFGLVDARAAVRLSESWLEQSTYHDRTITTHAGQGNLAIPDNGVLTSTLYVRNPVEIDRVTLFLEIDHAYYTDLKVELISPDGTVSQIFDLTELTAIGRAGADGIYYSFDSVQFWGEDGQGQWTLRVTDGVGNNVGTLKSWSLQFIGDPAGNDTYIYTDEFAALAAADPSRTVLTDYAGTDTLNAAALSGPVRIDLAAGNATLNGINITFAAGTRIENAIGGDGNDTLTGSADQNILLGGRGRDTITGGDGNDTIAGGRDGDFLYGGNGEDTLSYAGSTIGVRVNLATNDVAGGDAQGDIVSSFENVIGSRQADTLVGNSGRNAFEGGGGADQIFGGTGDDIASYYRSTAGVTVNLATGQGAGGDAQGDRLSSVEQLAGSDYDDTLTGTTGNNLLYGGAGNDTLLGGGGFDGLMGGDGIDTVSFAGLGAGVDAQLDRPYIGDSARAELRIVDAENLVGTSFGDTLTGNWGDNEIEGGMGGDTIDGMAGLDTASYRSSTAGVAVSLAAQTATGGHATGDRLLNVENLRGSSFADTLTGNAGSNVLEGGAGGDRLVGGAGFDMASYEHANRQVTANLTTAALNTGDAAGDSYQGIEGLLGSAFDDSLTGSAAADTLQGGDGNDWLIGNGGRDTIDGGAGIDTVDMRDLVSAQTIDLASGSWSTGAIAGVEIVRAGGGGDTLSGSAATETLFGGGGNDTIFWSRGGDSLDGGRNADTLSLATFNPVNEQLMVDLQAGTIGLTSGGQYTFLENRIAGFENVIGSAKADSFIASAASETISGGAGDDYVHSAGGRDSLFGGDGLDNLLYNTAPTEITIDLSAGTALGGNGTDWFSGFEVFQLSDYSDTAFASAGSEIIQTGDGDDFIFANGLNDTFVGREGFDTVSYQNISHGIEARLNAGGAGVDLLSGIEKVIGSDFGDTLIGSVGDEVLQGGGGNDILKGGGGLDTLDGGGGDDVIYLDPQSKTLFIDGQDGFDTVFVQDAGRTLRLADDDLSMHDIERLELGTGNSASLSRTDLTALDVSEFFVAGEASSALSLSGGGWTDLGMVSMGGEEWHRYSADGISVYIDPTLNLTVG